jgi:hypothetical protein
MAPYGSAIKAWPSGQIMATPMITRRGGYPVRYAKPVALASLTRSITPLTQHRRAPFVPSRALTSGLHSSDTRLTDARLRIRAIEASRVPAGQPQ